MAKLAAILIATILIACVIVKSCEAAPFLKSLRKRNMEEKSLLSDLLVDGRGSIRRHKSDKRSVLKPKDLRNMSNSQIIEAFKNIMRNKRMKKTTTEKPVDYVNIAYKCCPSG